MASPATSSIIHCLLLLLALTATDAVTINIINRCPFTVWPAYLGGGTTLSQGQAWDINVSGSGRVWGRTGCSSGGTGCQTGDCGALSCGNSGKPPASLAEYGFNEDQHFFDVSLVDGFNLPMSFLPVNGGVRCNRGGPSCAADINAQCPNELGVPGGCNDPCTVFHQDQYCCPPQSDNCNPTNYSRFFKGQCPDAYSYPKDDQTSIFNCPTGTNYQVIFCPSSRRCMHVNGFSGHHLYPPPLDSGQTWTTDVPAGTTGDHRVDVHRFIFNF